MAAHRSWDEHAKLLYADGHPDPTTGLGVAGTSGICPSCPLASIRREREGI
jgi:hypothetical protein